ncbi:ADP-ribosylglycohydrolase family protein, partial [Georgenia sp. 10Sc9-8]|nr:ADP-ribosylglycohydrolase family protein [Georgenia halotolerans]
AGLCAGDAMTWTGWWHRLAQLPPRRSVRLEEAWQHDRALPASSLPTPYLQSSPPSLIDPAGPTDDAEWFVVAVRHHLGQRLDGTDAGTDTDVWAELADHRQQDPATVRARVGTVIALENLAAGHRPPVSGRENPHYFDDIACVRAVAAGLLRPGDPGAASDLAEGEAVATHALDGVYGARATAALVAALVGGWRPAEAITMTRAHLPRDSWCGHVVAECLAAVNSGSTLDLAARLERDVVDHVYAYANQAPETLGLLLAHLRVARSGEELLLGALAHPRHADALVPLAGAVAGAVFGSPVGTAELPVLGGVSVRALAGVALEDVLADLTAHARTRRPVRRASAGGRP